MHAWTERTVVRSVFPMTSGDHPMKTRALAVATSTPIVSDEARAMLFYDPDNQMVDPTSFRSALRHLGNEGDIMEVAVFTGTLAPAAGMFGAMMSVVATVPFTTNPTVMVTTAATGCAASLCALIRGMIIGNARSNRKTLISGMTERVEKMAVSCTDPELVEVAQAARKLAADGGRTTDLRTLIRLDAVAIALDKAVEAAGPDVVAANHARSTAGKAMAAIMSSVIVEGSTDRAVASARTLEAVCASMQTETPIGLPAPTARIARILAIAEKALRSHPDIVDANGGRIDDLVRRHVPLLLELRAQAVETARPEALDSVDANFEIAFDAVARSIDEAVSGIHDEAMDALSTQMRFLAARRGDDPLLSVVA